MKAQSNGLLLEGLVHLKVNIELFLLHGSTYWITVTNFVCFFIAAHFFTIICLFCTPHISICDLRVRLRKSSHRSAGRIDLTGIHQHGARFSFYSKYIDGQQDSQDLMNLQESLGNMLDGEKPAMERHDSVISILSAGIDLCRICQCDSTCGELISPCYCSGSLRWVHQVCLQHWIRASGNKSCELCRYPYTMRSKLKPVCEWEALPMSNSEKRRFFCSALFHSIALGCVIWSLYVLIDRTVSELQDPTLEWQFWTKIVVEAIGCIGAGILIYVWGKTYFSVITKWIAFNRTFLIVNSSPVPIKRLPSCTAINVGPSSPGLGSVHDSPTQDKNRDAKALLLPPVVYTPPDSVSSESC